MVRTGCGSAFDNSACRISCGVKPSSSIPDATRPSSRSDSACVIVHSEIRLRKKVVKLKELRAKDATELSQLQTDVEHLVRAVNQLTVENRQLRGALSQPSTTVRVLPAQAQPERSL
ncbi:hypothetical protein AB0P40_19745 [Streptomyces sp. NPDC079189]|uniref:hypothetical protein n=1 Tax=unclassified Streptomyces TaxID=2593676 RepID=UPI0033A81879